MAMVESGGWVTCTLHLRHMHTLGPWGWLRGFLGIPMDGGSSCRMELESQARLASELHAYELGVEECGHKPKVLSAGRS